MALEITTVGAKVKYCAEATAGTRPTTGYTELKDVDTAPEVPFEYEALDCSNISDTVTRYTKGRQEPPGSVTFTLNHTPLHLDATQTGGWAKMLTAYAALTGGKAMWIEYAFPGAAYSFFYRIEPCALGTNGIEQNAVDKIPAVAIVSDVAGWATAST